MNHTQKPIAPIFLKLRQTILELDPAQVGLSPTTDLPRIWGLVMETGYRQGTATLVMLADGTTSLYISNGGGVIGCGEHPAVADSARACLVSAERYLGAMSEALTFPLPETGQVVFYGLTYQGALTAQYGEGDLRAGRLPEAKLYAATQAVITEVRQQQERRQSS